MAKRRRLTRPYPTHALQDVLVVAETIQAVNGGRPVATEMLADAVGSTRRSSLFTQHLNSSAKYGLTVGSPRDETVRLTALGESLTASGTPEQRADCIRTAALTPEVFLGFYEAYRGKRMPESVYGANTLTKELGVHPDLAEECLQLLRKNGLFSRVLVDRSGVLTIDSSVLNDADHAPNPHRPVARSSGNGDDATREHILLLAGPGAELDGHLVGMLDGLGLLTQELRIDRRAEALVPPELADALDTAHGCIFVWPHTTAAGGSEWEETVEHRAWGALGALTHALGEKVVVVDASPESRAPWRVLGVTAVVAPTERDFYSRVMAALIGAGIVSVSVG